MTKHTAPEVAAALRANLLDALKDKPRATMHLAAQLGVELQIAYRALVGLKQEGKVKSFADRRKLADGPSLVWMLPDAKPDPEDAPRRDPLVAALFGEALTPVDHLRAWLEENMPDLHSELGPMHMDEVRQRLNALTGCNVQASDSIEHGSRAFLAALQVQHAKKEPAP